jgi:hypothetical protein
LSFALRPRSTHDKDASALFRDADRAVGRADSKLIGPLDASRISVVGLNEPGKIPPNRNDCPSVNNGAVEYALTIGDLLLPEKSSCLTLVRADERNAPKCFRNIGATNGEDLSTSLRNTNEIVSSAGSVKDVGPQWPAILGAICPDEKVVVCGPGNKHCAVGCRDCIATDDVIRSRRAKSVRPEQSR